MPQTLINLLELTKNNGGTVNMTIFAKEQKHLNTVFEVCLVVVDPVGVSTAKDPQFTISLKVMLGTMTDQTDLFFQIR